jgi:hypothetical protein
MDGEVLSYALRRCWYASTPSEEVVEVRLVGSSRAVRDGVIQVTQDRLRQEIGRAEFDLLEGAWESRCGFR